MSRVLVTGAGGFVGGHLVKHLLARGEDVMGTYDPDGKPGAADIEWVPWALLDGMGQILTAFRPERIIHLASPSHVPTAAANPERTLALITTATMRLLADVRAAKIETRLLYVSSSEVYGTTVATALTETSLPRPRSIYAIAKLAAEQWLLSQAPDMTIVVRPFNQIGPGQSPLFAVGSFAQQIAQHAHDPSYALRVGNTDAERDFCDVNDSSLAHLFALEAGRCGEVYNICSGEGTKLSTLIDVMADEVGVALSCTVDPSRLRANEPARIVGDASKLRAETGWRPMSSAAAAARAAVRFHLQAGARR